LFVFNSLELKFNFIFKKKLLYVEIYRGNSSELQLKKAD